MTRRRFGTAGIAICAALVGIGVAFPRELLCVDTGPKAADYLVVLGGDVDVRAEHAAELFNHGIGQQVIVSGNGDCEDGRSVLQRFGVPKAAIVTECASRNTKENADRSVALLQAAHAQHVVVVTSWYHSRRALACFRHAAPQIQFESSPVYYCLGWRDWGRRQVGWRVAKEYLKIAFYAVRYGVGPFAGLRTKD